MAEYHVGCGLFGIYAGILNKKGDMWVNKSEVTDEVLYSAFDYLYVNKKEIIAEVDEKEYVMRIVPYKAENGKMLICPECGLDVHSDYKTCPRCGARMGSEDSV